MKVYIYSKFGVLDCEFMTLQAIEKSIPTEHESNKQLSEVTVGVGPADSVYCEEPGKSNLSDDQEIQE